MSKKNNIVENVTKSQTINIALDTIKKNKQAIVFVSSKASAEKQAEEIFSKINLKILNEDDKNYFINLSDKILNALQNPTTQCKKLSKVIKKGIAFHHSGLTSKQRELVEDSFRDNKLKIICSTPTLAAGLDLPAFRTILNSLKRFSNYGMSYIPVMEYKQMAGRAGRPGKENFGEAIIISNTNKQKEEIEEIFIKGEVEKIQSKLAVEPVLRTYLLSLISTGIVKTKEEIINFFDKTFWAHQFNDKPYLHSIINRMLKLLVDFEFIYSEENKNEFVEANKINNDIKFIPTRLGKRISQLYLDPVTANFIVENLIKLEHNLKENKFYDFSVIQMLAYTLEMRPYLRSKNKDWNDIQDKIIELREQILIPEPKLYEDDYDEYFNQFKTTLMIYDWINESYEQKLLEKYSIRPGEIKVKIDNAYWLIYASVEIARLIGKVNLISELNKIGIRIKNGVKEELIDLLKIRGIGRIRARKLFDSNIKTVEDFEKLEKDKVKEIVGRNIQKNHKEVNSTLNRFFQK